VRGADGTGRQRPSPCRAGFEYSVGHSAALARQDRSPGRWDGRRKPASAARQIVRALRCRVHCSNPFYQQFFARFGGFDGGIPTHDPSATAYLHDSSLFEVKRMPIFVETLGHCAGQTVPARRHQWHTVPEVNVCLNVDSPRVLELIRERLVSG